MRKAKYLGHKPRMRTPHLTPRFTARTAANLRARKEAFRERHPDTARLYHDHALAPAEGEPSEPDDAGLGHCRADHPERLDRDRTIGMEIIRAVEIDRVEVIARHKPFEIDHL